MKVDTKTMYSPTGDVLIVNEDDVTKMKKFGYTLTRKNNENAAKVEAEAKQKEEAERAKLEAEKLKAEELAKQEAVKKEAKAQTGAVN